MSKKTNVVENEKMEKNVIKNCINISKFENCNCDTGYNITTANI